MEVKFQVKALFLQLQLSHNKKQDMQQAEHKNDETEKWNELFKWTFSMWVQLSEKVNVCNIKIAQSQFEILKCYKQNQMNKLKLYQELY